MKRTVIFLFFLTASSLIYAQTFRETRIYVPPLDGTGYIDDMAYFYKQITHEITSQYRTLARTRGAADYVITGTIMPVAELGDDMYIEVEDEDASIIFIELYDNFLDEVISEQYVIYVYPDDSTNENLAVIIYNMLSVIPDSVEGGFAFYDAWRNKRLYLNANFLWVPRTYIAQRQSVYISGVGVEIMADYHFFQYLALKTGAELTPEYLVLTPSPTSDDVFQDMILSGMLAVAFVLRPLDSFMLEPYIGFNYNVSLQRTTDPYPLSWTVGGQLGIKTAIGIVTIDPRFSMDLGQSRVINASGAVPYWRYTIHLGIGYKIGFFDR